MKKLTNVTALEMVLALEEVKGNTELVEKLTKMKDQFAKKNNSGVDTKKPTKSQIENNGIKEQIANALQGQEPLQIKEILALPVFVGTEYTNQKFSALLKQMAEVGTVEKVVEKRVTKFKLIVDTIQE